MFKVLATLDGSPESEAALPMLERLAGVHPHVDLLTVVEPPSATLRSPMVPTVTESPYAVPGATTSIVVEQPGEPRWAEDEDQALQRVLNQGRDYLATFAHSLRETGLDVDVDAVVADNASDAIVEYARHHGIDLIIMATHGRSGLSELVQGSVASAVVRSGVAPVTLVRPAKPS
jgi:nucleotide-binding universal stress UspA family protein